MRTATGTGRTLLSAFDDALLAAGVANFNLLTPVVGRSRRAAASGWASPTRWPAATATASTASCRSGTPTTPASSSRPGSAGRPTPPTGGLFVEHSGGSEQSVTEQIQLSLEDMSRNRGGGYDRRPAGRRSAPTASTSRCARWRSRRTRWSRGAPMSEAPGAGDRSRSRPRWTPRPPPATTQLYHETFSALQVKAVARQLLHEHEFLEEMHDPRVHKYVAWDDDGEAVGHVDADPPPRDRALDQPRVLRLPLPGPHGPERRLLPRVSRWCTRTVGSPGSSRR